MDEVAASAANTSLFDPKILYIGLVILGGIINSFMSQIIKRQPEGRQERGAYQALFSFSAVLLPSILMATYFDGVLRSVFIYGLIVGGFVFINQVSVFSSLRRGPISIAWPIFWLSAPVSGITWFLMTKFKDFNSFWHSIGIGAFVLCLYMMGKAKNPGKSEDNNDKDIEVMRSEANGADQTSIGASIKPYFFHFVATGMLAGAVANLFWKTAFEGVQLTDADKFGFVMGTSLSSATLMFLYWKIRIKKINLGKKYILPAVAGGLTGSIQIVLMSFAMSQLALVTVACVSAGVAISGSVVLAMIFQKEKINGYLATGILLALFAIISFSLGEIY